MKAIGLHVIFVRSNLGAIVTIRHTYVDVDVLSRMFAVNVQNVLAHQMN